MTDRKLFTSSISYMRKTAADPNAISEVIMKHVQRSSSSIWLISAFLFTYFLVSFVFTVLNAAVNFNAFTTSDIVYAAGDIVIALFGMLTAALGFYSVNSLAVSDARRFFIVLLVFGLVYLLFLLVTAVKHYQSLASYLQDTYGFSLMNSLTTMSLGFVIVSYIVVSFILKSYNFQRSIQQAKMSALRGNERTSSCRLS